MGYSILYLYIPIDDKLMLIAKTNHPLDIEMVNFQVLSFRYIILLSGCFFIPWTTRKITETSNGLMA